MTVKDDWVGIARSLSEIEERYRKDRLRVGSAAQPAGAAREQLIDALERAVECYLDADDQQRQDMRDFFRVTDCLPRGLLPVAGRCQDRMHEGEVAEQLRRGLAAVSLENFHSDARDSFDCLGGLYLVAHQRRESSGRIRSHRRALVDLTIAWLFIGVHARGARRVRQERVLSGRRSAQAEAGSHAVMALPNPRVQRTRPCASLRGSPLTRHPLGDPKT